MQLDTTIKQRETIHRKPKSLHTDLTIDISESDGEQPIDLVIASLVDQLKRENENIAQLMERQRELRVELLKAQEKWRSKFLRSPSKHVSFLSQFDGSVAGQSQAASSRLDANLRMLNLLSWPMIGRLLDDPLGSFPASSGSGHSQRLSKLSPLGVGNRQY